MNIATMEVHNGNYKLDRNPMNEIDAADKPPAPPAAEERNRHQELADLHRDLEHLMRITDGAILYLDCELCIRRFTPRVAEVFDLTQGDIGRCITDFTHRLLCDDLPRNIRSVIDSGQPLESELRSQQGTCYFMRILPYRANDHSVAGAVVSFIDISSFDAVRTRAAHLSAIVESSGDAIVSVDLDGKILTWNQGATELYGFSESEAVGQDISLIVPPGELDRKDQRLDLVRRGRVVDNMEVKRLTKAGRTLDVSLTVSPIRDAVGRVIAASSISRDITERKRLQAAQARLAAIVRSSEDAIIGKTLEGIVSSWNAGAERLYGYAADEIIGQSMQRIVPAEKAAEFAETLSRLRDDKTVPSKETVRLRKDGRRVHVWLTVSAVRDDKGKVIGGSAIARDLSELKSMRREQLVTKRRFELAVEATNVGIWEWEPGDAQFYCTDKYAELIGYEPEEFDASLEAFDRRLHPADRERMWDRLNDHLQQPAADYDDEFRLQTKQGEYRWFQVRGSLNHSMAGEAARMVGTLTDIHWRKQAELRAQREVRQRDNFLAMLSHELRNPLGAVRNASMLIKAVDADERTKTSAAQVIDRQTEHMTKLLDELLDVSRITRNKIALNRRHVDFRTAIEEALEAVQPLADSHRVAVHADMPNREVVLNADQTRLEQVVTNLLVNAIKYSPSGTTVRLMLVVDGEQAVLRVIDKGAGMTADLLENAFELFVQGDATLDRTQAGIGVGLTLVHKLVELHGGSVIAESEGLDRGSTFTVCLPLAALSPRLPRQAPPRSTSPLPLVASVLLIEDQDDNRHMLRKLLELEGVTVADVADGRAGLELLSQRSFDAAIVDIGLPNVDGYEVARRVRAMGHDQLLLIALTGYGQPQDIERAKQAGFDQHLLKPLQPEQLFNVLRSRAAGPRPAAARGQ